MAKAVTAKRLAGDQYEEAAINYLQHKGLTLLTRNYSCKAGEIDLVMNDGDTIVFVEVRYRKSRQFGGAAVSVTPQKQRKIALAALHYLQKNKRDNAFCRFDVLAYGAEQQEWLKDAFYSPL